MRTRAWRRHQEKKKKSKMQKKFDFENWAPMNDDEFKRLIGIQAILIFRGEAGIGACEALSLRRTPFGLLLAMSCFVIQPILCA